MKKLTFAFATMLLALVAAANAESSTNSTATNRDAAKSVRVMEKPQTPTERLTYADFRKVKKQIDLSFQRLKSVFLPAMQCHMSVDRVNRLFKRYAHEDAEKYLASLKRNSRAAMLSKNTDFVSRQEALSWLDPVHYRSLKAGKMWRIFVTSQPSVADIPPTN